MLKEENKKFKGELKQGKTKLEEAGDGAIDLVKVNSKAVCYQGFQ